MQVEHLAHHAQRGEVWDKAVGYLQQAGDKAVARSANREALAYFEGALAALQHWPEGPETVAQEIDLRFALRNALFSLGEMGRILDHLQQAQRLAEALGDRRRLGQVALYLANYFLVALGDHTQAGTWAERGRAIGEELGDIGLLVSAEYHLGLAATMKGDFQQGMVWQRQLLARLAGDLGHEHFGLTSLISVNARHALAVSAGQLGAFRDGIAAGEEALRLAEAADHPSSLIAACFGLGSLLVRKGELAPARVVLGRALELCDTWDLRVWRPWVGAPLGYTYVLDGRLAEALPLLDQAVELSRSRAQGGYALSSQGWLAEAYWLVGQSEEGLRLAEQVLAEARTRGQRGAEALTLRLLGDMASQSTPVQVEQAEVYYGEALTLADELGMRPLQAHCQLGLGKLYARIRRRDEARAALAAALDLYRTLEMTFWLSQAEAALAYVERA